MDSVALKYFTVSQLREWLVHNRAVEGLSDSVIALTRAWAIINNPFVNDEMPVVSALFENNVLAAYTAAFPDVLQNRDARKCWWFSTLWCRKESEGRGYGLMVVGQLCDIYGRENCFDLGGARETVAIFDYLGSNLSYVPLHELSQRSFADGVVGSAARLKYKMVYGISDSRHVSRVHKRVSSLSYSIRYLKWIDDSTYHFILKNSHDDVFLRKQEMFNWIITYPFMNDSPICGRVPDDLAFTSTLGEYHIKAVQVSVCDRIVGFYIIRPSSWNVAVMYLYYLPEHKEDVFLSIVEHLLHYNSVRFQTTSLELADYVYSLGIYPNRYVYDLSFSYPESFIYDDSRHIQRGDGDLFV